MTESRTFADLGVSDSVVEALSERGIIDAFPIQTATIEASLAGRDICGKAPTGSGKTLAFGIPAVELSGKGSPWRPAVLILSPTRELATQIKDELQPLAKAHGRSILTVFGGTNIQRDIKRLEQGIDILVACPGRLEDLISRRCCELRDADLVIVDEADRMADMGFLPSVKRILDQTPDDRHTLLFSATLDGDVDQLIKRYQHDPLTVEVEEQVGEIGDVEHSWYVVEPANRIDSAVQILQRYYSSIVFCRTRRGCDRVAKMFKKKGLTAVAIHGDRSQNQRERALADFTSGKAQVLVATDVAARGIHVDNVALVMHYDPAGSDKDYIHRSGRTGRAGQDGRVISMVVEDKRKIARALQKDLGLKPGFDEMDLGALAPIRNRPVYTEDEAPKKKHRGDKQGGQNTSGGNNRNKPTGQKQGSKKQGGQKQGGSKNSRRNARWDDDDRRDGGGEKKRSPKDNRGPGRRSRNRNDDRDNRGRGGRNRDDDRDNRGRGDGRRRPPRRKAGNSRDWYPPEYYKEDREDRGRSGSSKGRGKPGGKKSGSGRSRDDDERTTGGSNTQQRKSRSSKGRHADKGSGRNKGQRRGGSR